MSSFTEDEREEKLRHLMDVYGDGLKRLCCVYLRDLGLAEDAVQETFIKAYDHINGITFFPQEPPYLLSITIYRKIKLYRLQRHL